MEVEYQSSSKKPDNLERKPAETDEFQISALFELPCMSHSAVRRGVSFSPGVRVF